MKKICLFLTAVLLICSCLACVGCGGECKHNYGDWVIIEESTCTRKGKKVKECSLCGEKQQEELPLAEHTYGEWQTVSEADCVHEGTKKRVCSCGAVDNGIIPATGNHSIGNTGVCEYCDADYSVLISEPFAINGVLDNKYVFKIELKKENDLTISAIQGEEVKDVFSLIRLYANDGTTEITLIKDGKTYKTAALDPQNYYLVLKFDSAVLGSDLILNAETVFSPSYGI